MRAVVATLFWGAVSLVLVRLSISVPDAGDTAGTARVLTFAAAYFAAGGLPVALLARSYLVAGRSATAWLVTWCVMPWLCNLAGATAVGLLLAALGIGLPASTVVGFALAVGMLGMLVASLTWPFLLVGMGTLRLFEPLD